ncbi:hypothetical protein [Anditalea andensis]|uniref:Uncharacterized protein n=1 Tax=Anditalea andensis TaxID=1048983 RepID=A0A074KUM3_9BACT|nr:hypothetical protein [Anditalea andensis]KEO71975.1 hypothetical protein EL17_20900 [Anditalea andensis]
MKNTIYHTLLGTALMVLFAQCKGQSDIAQNGTLNVIEYDHPILGGEFNEVAELVLQLNKPQFIRELSFDLTGQDTLESLRVIQVVKQEGGDEKLPIAAIKEVIGTNVVFLDRELSAGEHRFLISIYPKASQEYSTPGRIHFNHMATDKSKYIVTSDPI